MNRNGIVNAVSPVVDLLLVPLVIPAAFVLKFARRIGLQRLRWCRQILLRIGVLPLRSHYYEPFVRPRDLRHALDQERTLPGIEWDIAGQLNFLSTLTFEHELVPDLITRVSGKSFSYLNDSFKSGDAEYLYQVIRKLKPAKLVEIGSGQSTLVARAAIQMNSYEDASYRCEHVCIEPYESPWLESLNVRVIRERVQDVTHGLFTALGSEDLLFIDSSHVIRPQGDVVAEFLEILPKLARGVVVHVHDVFSPRDYPASWVFERLVLWNEQYLLEAFLTANHDWHILGALNMLKHSNFDALKRACPYLTPEDEPGSIYIQRR